MTCYLIAGSRLNRGWSGAYKACAGRTHRRTNPINSRHQAKRQGKAVPTNDKTKELSPETKLTIIIDTARLNET